MAIVTLDDYLNTIINKILAEQELCKLLYYDDDEPLSGNTIADTSVLSDKNNPDRRIYGIPFNSDHNRSQKTTLHIELKQPESESTFYKKIDIGFIILSHIHIWELYTSDGSVKTRPNLIVSKLNEIFNDKSSVGMGNAHYSELDPIYLNDEIAGYKLVFKNIDFSSNN